MKIQQTTTTLALTGARADRLESGAHQATASAAFTKPDWQRISASLRGNVNWYTTGNTEKPAKVSFVLDKAQGTVCFGDGVQGSRPETAHPQISSPYRYGLGSSGNMLIERPSYFACQLLVASDLSSEQDYSRKR